MKSYKIAFAVLVYLLCGFLTFGISYNDGTYKVPANQGMDAAIAGVMWPVYWLSYPVYWAGHFAIKVTK